MKFHADQIALCPRDPKAAAKLLIEMGATNWTVDRVVARGTVNGRTDVTNKADLAFNYDTITHNELEILHYTEGENWMDDLTRMNSVSHLGTHCTELELQLWRTFFAERGIVPIQEVITESHTNPAIAGKRLYHYVIFDTKAILSVDIKMIVRIDVDPGQPTA